MGIFESPCPFPYGDSPYGNSRSCDTPCPKGIVDPKGRLNSYEGRELCSCTTPAHQTMLCVSGPRPNKPSKHNRLHPKCSHKNCSNFIVKGGVCVANGARRKCCQHAGCDKAVKLAGHCSAHGPSWRKCDHEGGAAGTLSRADGALVTARGGGCAVIWEKDRPAAAGNRAASTPKSGGCA